MHLPLFVTLLFASLAFALPAPDATIPEDITSLAGGGQKPTATHERAAAVTPYNNVNSLQISP
jgi:hypothetical protein